MTYNLAYSTSFWNYGKCDKQYDYSDQIHTTCTRHYVCPLSCFYEDYEDEYDDYTATGYCFDYGYFMSFESEQRTSVSTKLITKEYYDCNYSKYLTTLTTCSAYFPIFSWCNDLYLNICFESVSSSNGLIFTCGGPGPDIWGDEHTCGYIALAPAVVVSSCAGVSTVCSSPRFVMGCECSRYAYGITVGGSNVSFDLTVSYDITTGYGQLTCSTGYLTSNTNGCTASVLSYRDTTSATIGGDMAHIPADVNLFYKGSITSNNRDGRKVYIGNRYVSNTTYNCYYTYQSYLCSYEITDLEHVIPYGHLETYTTKYGSDIVMCCLRGNVVNYSTRTMTTRVTCNIMAVLTGSKTVSIPYAYHNCYDDLTKRYTFTYWDYNVGAGPAICGAGCMPIMISNGQTSTAYMYPSYGAGTAVTKWALRGGDITLNDGRIVHPFESYTGTWSLQSNEQWKTDMNAANYSIEYTTTTFPEGIGSGAIAWNCVAQGPLVSCFGTTTTIPWDTSKPLYQSYTTNETVTWTCYCARIYTDYSDYTGQTGVVFVTDGLAPVRGCLGLANGITRDGYMRAYTTFGTTYSCGDQNCNMTCSNMTYEPFICGDATAWKYTASIRESNRSADIIGTIYKCDDYGQSTFGYKTFTGTKYSYFCNYPTDCYKVSTYYF